MAQRAFNHQAAKPYALALFGFLSQVGQRKDAKGAAIPAHFIQTVTATHNGKVVLSAEWGPAVSKNPFLAFKFGGGKPGEKVSVTWVDNKGDKRTDEATIS